MNVVLTPDGPLDAAATLSRYRIWGEDPVNRLGDGVFRRVVRRGNQLVPYEVRWQGSVDDPKLLLRIVGRRRSEEHTSELQSRLHLVCRLLLEKKKKNNTPNH